MLLTYFRITATTTVVVAAAAAAAAAAAPRDDLNIFTFVLTR